MTQETTLFLTTQFLFFQNEAVAMDFTNNAHSLHSQQTHSEEDFTSLGSEDFPLTQIFPQSTEQTMYNAHHNNTPKVPTNISSSENCEFKQTSADIPSAPS